MTTFIKMKYKKLDDNTNIDKYRVAANITKYHILASTTSKDLIFIAVNP